MNNTNPKELLKQLEIVKTETNKALELSQGYSHCCSAGMGNIKDLVDRMSKEVEDHIKGGIPEEQLIGKKI